MAKITTTALRGRWRDSDRWLSDGGSRGAGRLTARITRDGVLLYYQYFLPGAGRNRKDKPTGKLQRVPLGAFDEQGKRGLSLAAARDRAGQLAALYRSGVHDLNGHLEREREAAERARRAEEDAARRAEEDRQRGSLRQLVTAYIGHLEQNKKTSSRDVKSIFDNHLLEAAPDLAERKASEVPVDELVRIISKLVEADKGRTAGKLRSYLRAAYQLAIRSKSDPAAPMALRTFGITTNPVAAIDARGLSRFNRARERVLSAPELASLVKRIDAMAPGTKKDALRLCLLLGGQRPTQLLRARPPDVDIDAGTITLIDLKGARQQPRVHIVPLTKEAREIIARRLDRLHDGEPLLSIDGKTFMRPETLWAAMSEIVEKMVKEKEAREPFQLRDIRRTCETMLASLHVTRDVRGQLQSHGLSGVQQRHYDKHDYMREKRQALEKWARHLDRLESGKTASVIPLKKTERRS